MEIVGRERLDREAGRRGGHEHAANNINGLPGEPLAHVLRLEMQVAAETLIARDQGGSCCKGHLEADVDQAVRQHDQDEKPGQRHVAQRKRRPVEEDREEHDRDHDIRAHCRDGRARQRKIHGHAEQPGAARQGPHRKAQCNRWKQRQQPAQEPEHRARHQRHMQARDRVYMREARAAEIVEGGIVKAGRLPDGERGSDLARLPGSTVVMRLPIRARSSASRALNFKSSGNSRPSGSASGFDSE